jgi:hypothetical protein
MTTPTLTNLRGPGNRAGLCCREPSNRARHGGSRGSSYRQPCADELRRAGHRSCGRPVCGTQLPVRVGLPAEPRAKAQLPARSPAKSVAKFPAKPVADFELAAKLMAKSTARWIARPRFRPSCWPSWRPSTPCSSTGMTDSRFSASRQARRPSAGLASDRRTRSRPWSGLNAKECPKCTVPHRGVEVFVQTSVEVRVEGAGSGWERTSANREWETVPGWHLFRSGARIGNLTGKVTGNAEAHDRGGASRTAETTASRWRQRS